MGVQFTHREFPYSFGHWRCMLNGGGGAVPEHERARKQIQWKPIAGYLSTGTGDQLVHLKIA
ncbi:hypothetical protein StoSoilB20_28840 [Arthrobacter sp. StoSoilB20]|nr:hypothetical protein StoSoilB20_28840 [Arthrobacter sp. StoSoilB20]